MIISQIIRDAADRAPLARIYIPHKRFYNHYVWLLEESGKREASVQVQAGWAARSWSQLLGLLLSDLNDLKWVQKLSLFDKPDNEEQARMQKDDAQLWFSLTVRSTAQRAWSMLAEYDTAPASWSMVLHEDEAVAAAGVQRCSEDQASVEAAFAAANDRTHPEHEAWKVL